MLSVFIGYIFNHVVVSLSFYITFLDLIDYFSCSFSTYLFTINNLFIFI